MAAGTGCWSQCLTGPLVREMVLGCLVLGEESSYCPLIQLEIILLPLCVCARMRESEPVCACVRGGERELKLKNFILQGL